MERAIEKHYDLYEVENFDINIAGSRLIGRDISTLLADSEPTQTKVTKVLKTEVEKEEESQLINQILDTHSGLKYEQVYDCLREIIKGIED